MPPTPERRGVLGISGDSGWRLARCTDSIDRSSSDWRLQRCSSSLLLRLRLWCVRPRLSPCAAEPKRHGGYPADQQRHELGERTGAAAGAGRTQPGTRSKPRSRHRLRGERRAVLATRQHLCVDSEHRVFAPDAGSEPADATRVSPASPSGRLGPRKAVTRPTWSGR